MTLQDENAAKTWKGAYVHMRRDTYLPSYTAVLILDDSHPPTSCVHT